MMKKERLQKSTGHLHYVVVKNTQSPNNMISNSLVSFGQNLEQLEAGHQEKVASLSLVPVGQRYVQVWLL